MTVVERHFVIPRSDPQRLVLVQVQGLWLVAAFIMFSLFWETGEMGDGLVWCLSVFFTLHFIWGLWSWHTATGRWCDAYAFFFTSLCVFNGGQSLLITFGLGEGCSLFEAFSGETTRRTLLLVNTCVTAYHMAGLLICLGVRRTSGNAIRRIGVPNAVGFSANRIRLLGLALLAVSIPTTATSMMESIQQVAQEGYMALYQQEVQAGFANWRGLLASFFVPGVLLTMVAFSQSALGIKVCWALMFAHTLTSLVRGTRGEAVMGAASILFLHHETVCRIPRIYVVIISLLGVCVLPLIALTRTERLADRYETLLSGLTQNPYVVMLSETGGSATTVAHTLELVPTTRNFDYGAGYLYGLFTVVPNAFWERHPTGMRGTYSQWLIWTVDPQTAQNGGGLGYSVIAEAYANFSLFGPPVILALLGLALASFSIWVRRHRHPFTLALEAISLNSLLFLPRAESADLWRTIVWFCVIPYVIAVQRARK